MNLVDILISAVLLGGLATAVALSARANKNTDGCSGNCASCGASCKSRDQDNRDDHSGL